MHVAGGRHLNYCFRYSVTSYVGNYKNAGIPLIAERYVNPMTGISISAQSGEFKDRARSLLDLSTDMRLLCLKRADDGCGVIARFYGEYDENQKLFDAAMNHELSTVDERPTNESVNKGFITFRLGRDNIRICAKKEEELNFASDKPLPIGSVYTGLITKPMAAAGENMGHLYLLWGASREADFSHYKLYRSEFKDFVPDESNMIAEVYPEEYVVGRYVDTGLKDDTCYYYRVCAVNKAGVCGDMSEEFSAYTREPMTD
jgi:hypothetical protein